MPSAAEYQAKAIQCRKWAATALTPSEREQWLKLAADWDAMASERNPSGHLPWTVKSA